MEFSRSEVDSGSLSNKNNDDDPGKQNIYKKGNVKFYFLSTTISEWISDHRGA